MIPEKILLTETKGVPSWQALGPEGGKPRARENTRCRKDRGEGDRTALRAAALTQRGLSTPLPSAR